jgi:hypothetical protein
MWKANSVSVMGEGLATHSLKRQHYEMIHRFQEMEESGS